MNQASGPYCRLGGYYRAMEKCGGDWWWYSMENSKLQVIVGDVTGHGPGPAMITGSIASYFRALRSATPESPLALRFSLRMELSGN